MEEKARMDCEGVELRVRDRRAEVRPGIAGLVLRLGQKVIGLNVQHDLLVKEREDCIVAATRLAAMVGGVVVGVLKRRRTVLNLLATTSISDQAVSSLLQMSLIPLIWPAQLFSEERGSMRQRAADHAEAAQTPVHRTCFAGSRHVTNACLANCLIGTPLADQKLASSNIDAYMAEN